MQLVGLWARSVFLILFLIAVSPCSRAADLDFQIRGTVTDPVGSPLSDASVELVSLQGRVVTTTRTSHRGEFLLKDFTPGRYQVRVQKPGFQGRAEPLTVIAERVHYHVDVAIAAGLNETVTVTADPTRIDLLSPDPAEKVFIKQNLIDANPGRPGAPVSIPGYPIETASGGIKAPQYFAPGVAGDHGEPIAQFVAIGGYLLPNNLSANAHGNGYADPNIFVPAVIGSVQVDGGAFNVLEGNHSVNLAAVYGLRTQLDPFVTLTGDERDLDLVAGFNPGKRSWVATEASFGNGFLKRLEHRQQYKFNGERVLRTGQHELTLFGLAYFGSSYVPGLVPLFATNVDDPSFPNVGDTIDPRQKDQTHTALVAANDVWTLDSSKQLQFSGFFRTYNLSLFSDFGEGLIRQSEFRTVTGASTNFADHVAKSFALLAGLDFEREAPRRDDLDHYDLPTPGVLADGAFTKVDGNNVTITPVTPYAAAEGAFGNHLRYYAGWRHDQIDIDNQDLVTPANSFQRWVGVNSPKATLSLVPGPSRLVPLISASFGEAFFTEDPRIGTGTAAGSPVSTAHSYQVVASKTAGHTDLRLTLGHVTTSEELAKIDPDTGLQEDQGPGRLRFLTATAQQNFSAGSLLVTFSKADARLTDTGLPTPEAPRTIVDLLGIADKLPFKLQAKAEFEYVGRKPLGTGCKPNEAAECVGVSVTEFRAALLRAFEDERLVVGLNLLVANGFTGQTTENFYPSQVQEVVGVRIPSYVSANLSYHFGGHDTSR